MTRPMATPRTRAKSVPGRKAVREHGQELHAAGEGYREASTFRNSNLWNSRAAGAWTKAMAVEVREMCSENEGSDHPNSAHTGAMRSPCMMENPTTAPYVNAPATTANAP